MLGPVIMRNSLAADERDVVGDEGDVVLHFHARVAGLGQDCVAGAARVEFGPDVGCWRVNGDVREADDDI